MVNIPPSDPQKPVNPPIQSNQSDPPKITIPNAVKTKQFTGSQLILDPVSGYLGSPQLFNGFTVEKKILAVEHAKTLWPNLSAIAKSVGVNRVTLSNHMAVDDKFRMDLQAIANDHLDTLEQTMMDQGKQPRGYMDRITMLRAYRKERWNPDNIVTINHNSSTTPADRAQRVNEVIDTSLIDLEEKGGGG